MLTANGDLAPGDRSPGGLVLGDAVPWRLRPEDIHKHLGSVSRAQWDDWRWQLKNRLTTLRALARHLELAPEEQIPVGPRRRRLPLAVTPYYMQLVSAADPADPIRRCVIPTCAEQTVSPGEDADPLGEDHDSPVPSIVHRYPDRALFLVTHQCATYCRYCTRSRLVGQGGAEGKAGRRRLQQGLEYLRSHTEIRDVIVSGGDPLTLDDETLEWLLSELRRIPHIEMLRVGTKAPVVLPQRITPRLAKILRRHRPLWISIHFTPTELRPEVARACGVLADAGLPLGSQTVLLSGINDQLPTLRALFHGLLRINVRPYYLYQCDPFQGSAHFRTPVSRGLELIRGLQGHTSGYAVPHFVIDAPGGGGKIPLLPETCVGHQGDQLLLRNYTGQIHQYPDAPCAPGAGGEAITPGADR